MQETMNISEGTEKFLAQLRKESRGVMKQYMQPNPPAVQLSL